MSSGYKAFFNRLYDNAYRLGKKEGQTAFITLYFSMDKEKKKMAEKVRYDNVSETRSMADFYQPESILAIVETENEKKIYQREFKKEPNSVTQKSNNKTANLQGVSKDFPNGNNNMAGFKGFGSLTIEEYIEKKLEDERKDRRLNELESELESRANQIQELRTEINNLEKSNSKAETEKKELENILESKKSIRYWAGLTGDILESFGLKKENLREPLAGLIASENENEPKQISGSHNADDSGIVDDNTDNSKRQEIISLITEFLSRIDNQTLANVFLIFSEIESNNGAAERIIEFLNQNKTIK